MSWTPAEKIEQHENNLHFIKDIMLASAAHKTVKIGLEPLEFEYNKCDIDFLRRFNRVERETTPQKRVKIEQMDINNDIISNST